MTMTPNSPQELINMNQKNELTGEQVLEMIDELTPVQTIKLTDYLLKKLEQFHYNICRDINNGEIDQPIRIWEHDAYTLTHVRQLYSNLSDFND